MFLRLTVSLILPLLSRCEVDCDIDLNTKVIYVLDECATYNNGWKIQLDIVKETKKLKMKRFES